MVCSYRFLPLKGATKDNDGFVVSVSAELLL